ncbi:uncharacterized protein LAESUDRAFT_758015 [Laetiporus sulphureus 93-53]|uniref:Uncharacterized protein n=1 Tax=Laetiporus sulphureus 93-53 TaxID=1314785 RepID=A0A165EVV5_9APHY|nr:uncharacterized protein LAESUDRAFT_758015 [Laetiporus sulphureus 93-53]KZT07873.1 hypothetical protein LAESUDRAFT_758015 [Laetiporus sulphureus 93-53]
MSRYTTAWWITDPNRVGHQPTVTIRSSTHAAAVKLYCASISSTTFTFTRPSTCHHFLKHPQTLLQLSQYERRTRERVELEVMHMLYNVDTDTPFAEWEHGYGGRLCDSDWPNSQWASTSQVASLSSPEYLMRAHNRRSSEQHSYHEDAFEGRHRNLALPSQLSSSSLIQSPSMPPRNNHQDGIDFDLLDLAMESLVRLQEILDEASEGEAKDVYADLVEAEGSGMAN